MKKLTIVLVCLLAVTAVIALGQRNVAQARTTYAKAFVAKYVGDESNETQKTLALEIKRVKQCNVCHDPRKDESGKVSKKNRNPFGQTLAKHLTEKDQKDAEKATKMLEKIETEKIDGTEVTIGELIKAGKLPFEYPAVEGEAPADDEEEE
jgi:hypothetical protein